MMAAIIEKDVAIYLTKDLRLLFANKFIEEGYIKVFSEGQNVSFIHMSDGYVLLSRMNLIFKEKLDKMNNMLNDFTDLYSAAYDKENDEVSIFFTDNKIIDPYNENMVEFVNVLAEVLEISENHLGVDVRIEYSFNNCGYLVYRELDDIIGYRMLNNEEPERIFSYLTYQFMKDK